MNPLRIGIAGISGRMGHALTIAVRGSGAALAGGIAAGGDPPQGVALLRDIGELGKACDVVIDFTHPSTARAHAAALAASGTAWVLGTTGLKQKEEAAVQHAATRIAVVYAANFAPALNLLMALAERMGAALPAESYDAEIVEMHHRQKVDAPSGTALAIGRAVATGRGVTLEDVMESGRHGQTGERRAGTIGFAALRGGQVVGEHTLIFAGATEHIILSHRAFDRQMFAGGAVRAAQWTQGKAPGLYGMKDVLGLM